MNIREALGRRVRALREAAGLSQAEVASAADISRVYLGVLERGQQAATVDVLERIAGALQATPAELLAEGGVPAKGKLTRAEAFAAKIAAMAEGASAADLARFERVARGYFGQPRGGVG